jgi:hypothetical protein
VVIGDLDLERAELFDYRAGHPEAGKQPRAGLANFGGPIKIPHLVPRNGPNLVLNYQWVRNRTPSPTSPGADRGGADRRLLAIA